MGNRPAKFQRSVFINVPYDLKYERLFAALIAGIVSLCREPKVVLSDISGDVRLDRLIRMIRSCRVSLHDLSRTGATRTPAGRVPRFNMPIELGIALAIKKAYPRKKYRPYVL